MNKCDLNTLEQINSKVVESSPDAKIIIDSDGKIVVFNQRAEFMFGWGREEVLGKPVEMLMPEAMRDRHVSLRTGYLEDPRIRDMGEGRTVNGLYRGDREFIVQIRLAPLIITGAGMYVLAVVRRTKAEAEEVLAAKQLVANAAEAAARAVIASTLAKETNRTKAEAEEAAAAKQLVDGAAQEARAVIASSLAKDDDVDH